MLKCSILDDYQDVALATADWASLGDEVAVRSHSGHFGSTDELVVMRERTPFPAELFARLPELWC